MTTRMIPPTPAQPSSVTTGSVTSQIKGSPIACASPASVENTANKVGLCAWERAPEEEEGSALGSRSRSFQCPLCYLESDLTKFIHPNFPHLENGANTIPFCIIYPLLCNDLAPKYHSSKYSLPLCLPSTSLETVAFLYLVEIPFLTKTGHFLKFYSITFF